VPRNVTQIKQLVLNGVEGLSMDKVSVVAVPGTKVEPVSTPALELGGLQLYKSSLLPLAGVAGVAALLMAVVGFFAGGLIRKRQASGRPLLGLGKAKQSAGELAKL
jgi:type III secretory pathway lipoprotein EscJ